MHFFYYIKGLYLLQIGKLEQSVGFYLDDFDMLSRGRDQQEKGRYYLERKAHDKGINR